MDVGVGAVEMVGVGVGEAEGGAVLWGKKPPKKKAVMPITSTAKTKMAAAR